MEKTLLGYFHFENIATFFVYIYIYIYSLLYWVLFGKRRIVLVSWPDGLYPPSVQQSYLIHPISDIAFLLLNIIVNLIQSRGFIVYISLLV
jgi:hypothetical protein